MLRNGAGTACEMSCDAKYHGYQRQHWIFGQASRFSRTTLRGLFAAHFPNSTSSLWTKDTISSTVSGLAWPLGTGFWHWLSVIHQGASWLRNFQDMAFERNACCSCLPLHWK